MGACYRSNVPRFILIAVLLAGCAVDPSGIPGRNAEDDAAITDAATDLFVPDGPVTPDLGRDLGMRDFGPEVDMAMEDDLGVDMGPPDMGPPDLGPPDLGPPDMGPPDMFRDGGCGMAEVCNAVDDDCDGNIDENPGGPRGENACPDCTRAVSPGGVTYQICPISRGWFDAVNTCRSFGYELASPETAAEDTFLDSVLISGDDYWIALNDDDDEGTFEWEDRPADRPLGSFDDWQSGEPNGGAFDDCVRIELDTLQWRDTDCEGLDAADNFYACEAP